MRVVSLLASGTEIVCGLGAGEWLVGRSHECDNPPWVAGLPECTRPAFDVSMSSGRIDAEVRRRLKASEPLYNVDTDLINSLEPDLLITQEHCNVCAVTPADVKRAGCVAAVQVLALRAGSVQGILDGIFSIARALGREKDAANLVDAMKGRVSTVHTAVKRLRAPSLVVLEWIDPVFAMGNWGPELVEAANGRLMLGEKGEFSKAIDWQRVRAADPEWLIVAPCGFDLERTTREVPTLEALPGWFDLSAVRQGKVALADGNKYFNRSGTTIVETVEILAEILHGYSAGHRGRAWLRYSRLPETVLIQELHARACANNLPTYTDPVTGYEVFTAGFLRQRGYCCGNGCRHCPYPGAADLSSMSNSAAARAQQ
jgi:iron complex transport system substrate-binding protein